MRQLLIYITIFAGISFSSCTTEFFDDCLEGNDAIETLLIDVDEVTEFDISFSSDVTIEEGDVQKIELIGPKSIIDKIAEDSRYDNKEFDMKLNGCSSFDKITLNIVIAKLEGIDISGDSDVVFNGKFNNVDDVKFGLSGSCTMDINIGAADKVDVDISGDGSVDIVGSATEFKNQVSGDGKVRAFDFPVQICDIDISGNGNIEVNVENELKVQISGSANVCYKGSPTLEIDLSGFGSVEDCN